MRLLQQTVFDCASTGLRIKALGSSHCSASASLCDLEKVALSSRASKSSSCTKETEGLHSFTAPPPTMEAMFSKTSTNPQLFHNN